MDFSWTPAQDELYDRVLRLAQARLNRTVAEREPTHTFGMDEWRVCGELGLMGLCVPERYGGLELDALSTARMIEAFGRGCEDMGLVFSASAHLFAAVMPIVDHGDDAQKERFLPRLADGTWIGANAITEGEAGSDAFALRARATRDGDHYVLSGAKTYVSNGPVGDVFLVYATLNPAWGYLGVTAFLVERGTPGLVIGQPFQKMGLTTSPTCSIYLEDCRVPIENRLGREGQGGAVFRGSMLWERACLFAAYLGMMDRQLQQTITYAQERRQFGRPIGKNQAISHRIADMKIRLESARLLLYHACWRMARGENAVLEVSMAKVAISEAAQQSSLAALQIHGGVAFSPELGIERMLRDSVPSTLFSGTSEIQRDLIALELGL